MRTFQFTRFFSSPTGPTGEINNCRPFLESKSLKKLVTLYPKPYFVYHFHHHMKPRILRNKWPRLHKASDSEKCCIEMTTLWCCNSGG